MVSPLVSLMEDQVMALHTYNVEAEMLNASTDKNKLKAVRYYSKPVFFCTYPNQPKYSDINS